VVLAKRWYNRRSRLLRWLADRLPQSGLHPQWSASAISLPEFAERDRIARRAYRLWQERGCPTGSPMVDWLRAEQELRK